MLWLALSANPKLCRSSLDPIVIVGHTEVTRLETQGLTHIEKGIEHEFLRHHAQLPTRLRRLGGDIKAMHCHGPCRGFAQTRKDADECGFACAIGAKQAKKFARLDVKAHTVQSLKWASVSDIGFGNGLEGNSWHGKP
jgi:hypothetical protein